MSGSTSPWKVGDRVLWKSKQGYTPPEGEVAIVNHVWPNLGAVRLTLDAGEGAPPEFGGACSMCATLDELSAIPESLSADLEIDLRDLERMNDAATVPARGPAANQLLLKLCEDWRATLVVMARAYVRDARRGFAEAYSRKEAARCIADARELNRNAIALRRLIRENRLEVIA